MYHLFAAIGADQFCGLGCNWLNSVGYEFGLMNSAPQNLNKEIFLWKDVIASPSWS